MPVFHHVRRELRERFEHAGAGVAVGTAGKEMARQQILRQFLWLIQRGLDFPG